MRLASLCLIFEVARFPLQIFILFRVGNNCKRSRVLLQKQFVAVSILSKHANGSSSRTLVSCRVWKRASHIIARPDNIAHVRQCVRALQNSWSVNSEEVNNFNYHVDCIVPFSAIPQLDKCHVHLRKRRKISLARSR